MVNTHLETESSLIPNLADGNIGIFKGRRGITLCILSAVFAVSILDRQIIGLLAQSIKKDLQLSDTELGLLYGLGFAFLYGTLGFPLARYGDRGNRASLVKWSLVFFSIMTALCGLATGYWQLIAARIGVAIGESGTNPPSHSMISDLYGRNQRSVAMAIFSVGSHVGLLLGFLVGGWVGQIYGWRAAIICCGAFGLIVSAVGFLFLREPPRSKLASSLERLPTVAALRVVLASSSARHIVFGSALFSIVVYAVLGWLPSLIIRNGLTVGQTGTNLAVVLGVGGAIGTTLGGLVSDRFSNGVAFVRLRIVSFTIGLMAIAWLAVFNCTNSTTMLVVLVVPGSLVGFYLGPTFAMIQSLVHPGVRATAAALLVFTGNVIGLAIGPLLVGILSDALRPSLGDNSLRYAMMVAVPLCAWSAVHYFLASYSIERDLAEAANSDYEF